jgi:FG-GAP-like repeat
MPQIQWSIDDTTSRVRLRLAVALGAILASAALMGGLASPASALPQNFFGLGWNGEIMQSEDDWDAMQHAGSEVFRINLFAKLAEDEYHWETYDQIFAIAAKHGSTVLPVLAAQSNPNPQGFPTEAEYEDPAWEEWIYASVGRYGYGGDFWDENPTLPYKPVEAWEVWNEANLAANNPQSSQKECEEIGQPFEAEWNTCVQPHAYGRFLRAVGPDLRAAQEATEPNAPAPEVLFSGVAPSWQSFVEEAHEVSGVASAFDGMSIHPYGSTAANSVSQIAETREMLDDLGATDKSIWVTEMGWAVDDPEMDPGEFSVSDAQAASRLEESFDWIKAESEDLNIRAIIYYNNRDIPLGGFYDNTWMAFCGLRNRAGENRLLWTAYREETGAAPWLPAVSTETATSVRGTSATLNANVDGHGFAAGYRFEYLTEAEYEANGKSFSGPNSPDSLPAVDAAAGPHARDVRQTLTGLATGTTYRYRVVAQTSEGESQAAGKTFTTQSSSSAPGTDGDVNGDGYADLATLRANGLVYVHPGGGTSKFGSGVSSFSDGNGGGILDPAQYDGEGNYVIDVADVDGDGRSDLVTLNDGDVHVYAGKTGSALDEAGDVSDLKLTPAFEPGGYEPIAVADVDGDGYGDLIVHDDRIDKLTVYFGNSGGTFDGSVEARAGVSSGLHDGQGHHFVDAADVTGDGRADLVSMHDDDLDVFVGEGGGTFSAPEVSHAGEVEPAMDDGQGLEPFGLGDTTGDGKADLGVVGGGSVYTYPGKSDGSFGTRVKAGSGASTTFGSSGSEAIGLLDVDNDDKAQLVFVVRPGDLAVAVPFQANGSFAAPAISSGTFPSTQHFKNQSASGNEFVSEKPSWRRKGCELWGCAYAGTDTIGMYRPGDEAWYLRNSNSSGAVDVSFGYSPGSSAEIPLVGDWDGDGKDTIGMYEPVVGSWNEGEGIFHLRNGNSSGTTDVSFAYTWANAAEIPLVGDWDGDGKDTIGMYQPVVGEWNEGEGIFHLRNSNSSGAADYSFGYNWANPAEIPLVGDWDGDGKDTIGMYQPVVGSWNEGEGMFYLRNSNSSGAVDYSFAYTWANPAEIPLVGDWDGDGDDTIGMFQPGDGKWHLRNSNSSGAADYSFAYSWGAEWDVPITGDWDGDSWTPTDSDVDRDGRSDLVTVDSSGEAEVFAGTASGLDLGSPTASLDLDPALLDGEGDYVIDVADVNGDGRSDLVTAGSDSAGVSVHRGKSGRTFKPGVPSLPGAALSLDGSGPLEPIAVADVTGDGYADMVGHAFTVLAVSPGRADGTFATGGEGQAVSGLGIDSALLDATGEYFLDAADVNGDGHADAVSMNTNGSVYVFTGRANGTFKVGKATAGIDPIMDDGTGEEPIGLGDVNGDRRADLLTLADSDSKLRLRLGNADGTFATATTPFASTLNSSLLDGTGVELIGLFDHDADGLPDLVALNSSGDIVSYKAQLALGSGVVTFASPITSAGSLVSVAQSSSGSEFASQKPLIRRAGCDSGGCDFP